MTLPLLENFGFLGSGSRFLATGFGFSRFSNKRAMPSSIPRTGLAMA
jgi:hypothetical protein